MTDAHFLRRFDGTTGAITGEGRAGNGDVGFVTNVANDGSRVRHRNDRSVRLRLLTSRCLTFLYSSTEPVVLSCGIMIVMSTGIVAVRGRSIR